MRKDLPEVMVQTVDSVRKYLDGELAKCKTYKDLDRLNLVYLIKSEPEFRSVKGKGVDSVRKYLNNILEPFKNYNDLKKTNLNLSRKELVKKLFLIFLVEIGTLER